MEERAAVQSRLCTMLPYYVAVARRSKPRQACQLALSEALARKTLPISIDRRAAARKQAQACRALRAQKKSEALS